jgi:hypothetical protein
VEDVDALLLGMASQIAEREDHAGCASLDLEKKSSWICRARQGGAAQG